MLRSVSAYPFRRLRGKWTSPASAVVVARFWSLNARHIIPTGPVAGENVKKFFEETVPAFLHHHQQWQIEECTAEIWTTGLIDNSARAALEKITLDRRVRPALVDGVGLKQKIPITIGSMSPSLKDHRTGALTAPLASSAPCLAA